MDKIKNRTGTNSSLAVTVVLFYVIFFFVIPFSSSIFTNQQEQENSKTVDPGFIIDQYDIDMVVAENNVVNVKESITVTWKENGHHGIFKFIPEWLEYTGMDDKTIRRKSLVKNLQSNMIFTVDNVSGKKRIKIGDANKFAEGTMTYVFTYDYDMGNDPFEEQDEFIFHAFGDFWYPKINNFNINIEMPKDIDSSKIYLFKDKYHEKKAKDINYEISEDGKNITIYGRDSGLDSALTIEIPLDEGYFEAENNNYGYLSMTICLVIIAFLVATLILWIIYGKDLPKEPETVEFYSPDDLDPAEVGYIEGKQTGKKLIAALLVSLASKGYIAINKNGKKKIDIENLVYHQGLERHIKADLVKNIEDQISDSDKEIINKYFAEKNNASIYGITCDEFEKETKDLVEKGFIKIKSDKMVSSKNSNVQVKIADNLPKLSNSEKLLFNRLFPSGGQDTDISSNKDFYKVFAEVSDYLEKDFNKKLEEPIGKNLRAIIYIILIPLIISWFIAFTVIEDLDPKYSALYYISLGTTPFTFLLGHLMTRRTKYGEVISARVRGFKNYIKTAEKAEIEEQVEKNPNYFFAILPFAYSLHVSKKWIKNFEKLDVKFPETAGNFDYNDVNSYSTFSSNVSYPSSGGGSSSCGGGCSSCGGGCSSCGGGGSW